MLLPQPPPNGPIRSDEFSYSGIARLKPGATLPQANQDIARVLRIWGDTEGTRQIVEQLRFKPQLRPLKQDVVGDVGPVLAVLMGALALVLLLVCANVANLVQVRAQGRRREFAIRAALGAGWGRIALELLAESFALGMLGGAMALALAYAGIQLLADRGSETLPRLGGISIDSTGFLFGLACSLGSGLLLGWIAVLKSGRNGLIGSAREATATIEHLRSQSVLVVAQVGLALVLLVAAGLTVRSFMALRAVTPGFTLPKQVQTVRIFIPEAQDSGAGASDPGTGGNPAADCRDSRYHRRRVRQRVADGVGIPQWQCYRRRR